MYEFYSIKKILYEDKAEELVVKAKHVDNLIDAYATAILKDRMDQLFTLHEVRNTGRIIVDRLWNKDSVSLGLQNDYYRLLGVDGTALLSSPNMTKEIENLFKTQFSPLTPKTSFRYLKLNGNEYYGINYLITYADRKPLTLQLATSLTSTHKILAKQGYSFIGGIIAIMLMTVFMGTFLTRRILKSVVDVTHTANSISQTNLSKRISVEEMDYEMKLLVGSFNRMIDRLEKSFSCFNEFNSHVAHELKTPLAIIKGELELAVGAGNTQEENESIMKGLLQEINRLIKIIKDLLLLTKFEYEVDILKKERMEIKEFLNDIYQHVKVLADGKNINLGLSMPDQPIEIMADSVHLRRVLLNLINNAIKFTPEGGQIIISSQVSKKDIHISVKDTGIGIALADQSRIFEKFFRSSRINQENSEGNGLGLAMSRAIARSHGGDITFESDVRKGTTFNVRLPFMEDDGPFSQGLQSGRLRK